MLNIAEPVGLGLGRMSRRAVLKVGALALGGLSLADVLRGRAAVGASSRPKSVIMIWLRGGPSHRQL